MSTLLNLLLLALLLLAGCGFQLRGAGGLPPEMAMTQLVVDDPYSTLARRLRTLLERAVIAKGAAVFNREMDLAIVVTARGGEQTLSLLLAEPVQIFIERACIILWIVLM